MRKVYKNTYIEKVSCEQPGGHFTLLSGKRGTSGEIFRLKEGVRAKTEEINKEQTQSQRVNWKCLDKEISFGPSLLTIMQH